MSSEIVVMPNGNSMLEKMWRFSAPLASVVVILYVIWQILITITTYTPHPSNSATPVVSREIYDAKILEILDKQATAITILSQNQGDIKRLLEDQQKLISIVAAEVSADNRTAVKK